MKVHDIEAIKHQLDVLKNELNHLNLWGGESKRPSIAILEKGMSEPFGVGILEFHEWLEYVLIATLLKRIACAQDLPRYMVVHTFAEVRYAQELVKYQNLIDILKQLDELISLDDKEEIAEEAN